MYPSTSLFIAIGQLAIVILVLFSYPLQVHPCRNCLDKVFGNAVKPVEDSEVENIDEHHEMSTFKHAVLTTAIITCGFTIAYFVDDLQMGKYCHSLTGFVLTPSSPSVCWIYRFNNYFVYPPRSDVLEGE